MIEPTSPPPRAGATAARQAALPGRPFGWPLPVSDFAQLVAERTDAARPALPARHRRGGAGDSGGSDPRDESAATAAAAIPDPVAAGLILAQFQPQPALRLPGPDISSAGSDARPAADQAGRATGEALAAGLAGQADWAGADAGPARQIDLLVPLSPAASMHVRLNGGAGGDVQVAVRIAGLAVDRADARRLARALRAGGAEAVVTAMTDDGSELETIATEVR